MNILAEVFICDGRTNTGCRTWKGPLPANAKHLADVKAGRSGVEFWVRERSQHGYKLCRVKRGDHMPSPF